MTLHWSKKNYFKNIFKTCMIEKQYINETKTDRKKPLKQTILNYYKLSSLSYNFK